VQTVPQVPADKTGLPETFHGLAFSNKPMHSIGARSRFD
jgi:hypothetical protein